MTFRPIFSIGCMSALLLWCMSCSENGNFAGATDTETGGTTVIGCILKNNGTPAPKTIVTLIPSNYNPLEVDSTSALLTDTTNAFGYYEFHTSVQGQYNIQAYEIESSKRALLYGVHCIDSVALAPVGILAPPGTLNLVLHDSIGPCYSCYIPGTNFFAMVRSVSGFVVIDSVPAGMVPSIRYLPTENSASSDLRYGIPVFPDGTTKVFNLDWRYCWPIFLNTSASGANINEDVVQFPVLISLNSGNFDFSQTKTDGSDIRFTKYDNTFLPYEIQYWDAANSQARIWVKIDTVHGNDSMQAIFMYWGNANALDSSNSETVFDTAMGFQGVWHLDEKGNDSAHDATANHFNGNAYNMADSNPDIPGPLGMGRCFNGESSYITMPNTADGKLNFPENGDYSISAWVYVDTLDNEYSAIVAKGFQQYVLWLTYFPLNNPQWEFFNFKKFTNWNMSSSRAQSKKWVLLTGVQTGGFQYLYCNGEQVAARNAIYPNGLLRDTTNDLAIGRFLKEAIFPLRLGYCFFKGNISEVRISSVARSDAWERLAYINQQSGDKFIRFMPPIPRPLQGPESPIPGNRLPVKLLETDGPVSGAAPTVDQQ